MPNIENNISKKPTAERERVDALRQTDNPYEYGHLMGDKFLKTIAKIIKENIRESDFAYRYAGDEFAVFLPDSDTKIAIKVAEKIRQKIETDVPQQMINLFKATISVGCADTDMIPSWTMDQSKIDMQEIIKELIDKADQALYQSKDQRNKVTIYSHDLQKNNL
ncbi:hypothetical protein COX27_01365 [Candidatus Kuenenbacteria bacterium CG23_combo_of_CG06-09_8_20_14_all_36_9]|uniref:GGDEF domain-containing protein n=1 Tax=Candidatus Kuenenbacteria bacterium CG10_big_fil_rev_8_21_14_0_10_36_11 TaxID=1974618 RepID=A0A2M6WBE0_9BACT|nr:MAG: hypothetical protein COX27_01365 [Candidatus Kuenenbacteria bacterium CG23_combo_of_CG06-09_8_20_14_all_36_9]PIT90128.1 MAG: hypothetical protein COU23_00235 [Candidatus Kuenenbacteria bacterium CG10_big_fil_rev_8_21_14_0_10_36_11]